MSYLQATLDGIKCWGYLLLHHEMIDISVRGEWQQIEGVKSAEGLLWAQEVTLPTGFCTYEGPLYDRKTGTKRQVRVEVYSGVASEDAPGPRGVHVQSDGKPTTLGN